MNTTHGNESLIWTSVKAIGRTGISRISFHYISPRTTTTFDLRRVLILHRHGFTFLLNLAREFMGNVRSVH